jgi:hypothetical protein
MSSAEVNGSAGMNVSCKSECRLQEREAFFYLCPIHRGMIAMSGSEQPAPARSAEPQLHAMP